MALKIAEKLEAARKRIEGGDVQFADDLASAGMKAVFGGIGKFDHTGVVVEVNQDWEDLMKLFGPTPTELARLCGKDRKFNGSEWGKVCLTYVAGDSICTAATARRGGTTRTMNEDPDRGMLEALDAEDGVLAEFSKNVAFFNK